MKLSKASIIKMYIWLITSEPSFFNCSSRNHHWKRHHKFLINQSSNATASMHRSCKKRWQGNINQPILFYYPRGTSNFHRRLEGRCDGWAGERSKGNEYRFNPFLLTYLPVSTAVHLNLAIIDPKGRCSAVSKLEKSPSLSFISIFNTLYGTIIAWLE